MCIFRKRRKYIKIIGSKQTIRFFSGFYWINPIPYGGGNIAPPTTYCRITQNWPGPKARAFGTFILI